MKSITVLLAEDHLIVRQGLRSLLKSEIDIEVIGEAANGREAVQMAKTLHPAVIIMDVAMPHLNGLEATRQILEELPQTRIIILSAHSDDAYVEQATSMGAAGYLIKQTSANYLAKAVREVNRGNIFFSKVIAKRLQADYEKSPTNGKLEKKKSSCLTARELQVLQLIAEGKSNKQIADDLTISIKTVEKHRQKLMDKLNIHETASLTRYAISAGIIESSVQNTTV